MNSTNNQPQQDSTICPRQWDGWNCWEPSQPGHAMATCPDMAVYLMGSLPASCLRSNGIKDCGSNGEWIRYSNPYFQRFMVRSDYEQCSYLGKSVRSTRTIFVIVLESISLVCAIIGLILFTIYQLYSQFRLQIHVNFFFAIILSSIVTILYEFLISKANLDMDDNVVLET